MSITQRLRTGFRAWLWPMVGRRALSLSSVSSGSARNSLEAVGFLKQQQIDYFC
jgi:hypothetical protein